MNFCCRKVRRLYTLAISWTFVFYYYTWYLKQNKTSVCSVALENQSKEQIYKNNSCQIPQLDSFNASILKLISEIPKPLLCDKDYHPLLFNSNIIPYSHLIPIKPLEELDELGVRQCYFKSVSRTHEGDSDYLLGYKEFPLSFTKNTTVPKTIEFIAIFCKIEQSGRLATSNRWETRLMDVHAFAQAKIKRDSKPNTPSIPKSNKFNVIVLGLDGVSRMSFQRTFVKTRHYLLENLNAIEMTAYHKIGDNTFPNVAPMLTNKQAINEANLACERNEYFDKCPFIWKDFAKADYKTLFAEDISSTAIFNYLKHGFKAQPTDYYLRPLMLAANGKIIHDHTGQPSKGGCIGPRPAYQVMVDYMQQLSWQMTHGPEPGNYFQFGISCSVTHDILNGGMLMDSYLYNALKRWDQGGYLNNTVMVLFSDHGHRYGEFRTHFQGQLEERLPLMHFVVPSAFIKAFPQHWQNLVENRHALVTALDLQQSLLDILYLSKPSLSMPKISKTQIKYGRSLFSRIPVNRTCKMAGVPEAYCACTHQVKNLPVSNPRVKQVATFAIQWINQIIQNFSQCSLLSLGSIFEATETQLSAVKSERSFWKGFRIGFKTQPGNATMEAFVMWNGLNNWKVSGDVLRTNLYGNQSHCVHDARAKKYCYCKDLVN